MSSPYLCIQMHIMQVYSWKSVPVFSEMQKLLWPVSLHLFPLPVISSGMQALEHEGERRFPPQWGCHSSPPVSCRHSGSWQAEVRGERGRHRTYNNNSSNKFGEWGNTLALQNHSITYFNNVKERGLCVSVCVRERERQNTSQTKRKRKVRTGEI